MELVASDSAGLTVYLSDREFFALARPEGILDREARENGIPQALTFTFGTQAVAMHLPVEPAKRIVSQLAGHLVEAALKRIIAGYLAPYAKSQLSNPPT